MACKLSEEQKTLRKQYMDIMKEYWHGSASMIAYEEKNIGTIVSLGDGDICVIDKPRIETNFCFGYGMYLRSDEEEERAAFSMEAKARTDESYFISQNLKPLDDWIEALQDTRRIWVKRTAYINQKDRHLVSITSYQPWELPENAAVLTQEEINSLVAGYEEVKQAFTKRLNTYLKRYGLSKLNTWTYLRD